MIPLAKPPLGEEEALAAYELVRSGWVIHGLKGEEFEKEFAAYHCVKHAVAVASGSIGLLAGLQALGVKRDDEVIVPDMTFISTATAALYLGATPIFADIELKYYGIKAESLEAKISQKTAAIIPVHYAGHSAEMDSIVAIAKSHGIPILEDAAEAHGAKYKGRFVGTLGSAGVFSFTPSKPITTGEGGMVVTDSDDLYQKLLRIREFGDTGKFQWDGAGFNFRMDGVAGAIGVIQMKKLSSLLERRRAIGSYYTEIFRNIEEVVTPTMRTPEDGNYQLYTIRVPANHRDDLMQYLAREGVQSRLYYPTLHNQFVFSRHSQHEEEFPNAQLFAATALSLPLYADLKDAEVEQVANKIIQFFKS